MKRHILIIAISLMFINNNFVYAQQTHNPINYKENFTRTNSLYAEVYGFILSINYGKALEYKPQKFFTLNGGLTYFDNLIILGESTLLLGKNVHFIEPGIGFIVWSDEKTELDYTLRLGCRYQGKQGLLLKAGLSQVDGGIAPTIGVGYSF
ncbi:hypothetical protein ACFL4H_00975 [Candidatus Neomarinimicrobiota bacterium]